MAAKIKLDYDDELNVDEDILTFIVIGYNGTELITPSKEWKTSHTDFEQNKTHFNRVCAQPSESGEELIISPALMLPIINHDFQSMNKTVLMAALNHIYNSATALKMKPFEYLFSIKALAIFIDGDIKKTEILLAIRNLEVLMRHYMKQDIYDVDALLKNPHSQDFIPKPIIAVQMNKLSSDNLYKLLALTSLNIFVSSVTSVEKIDCVMKPKDSFVEFNKDIFTKLLKNQLKSVYKVMRVHNICNMTDREIKEVADDTSFFLQKVDDMPNERIFNTLGAKQLFFCSKIGRLANIVQEKIFEFLGADVLIEELQYYALHKMCNIFTLLKAIPWRDRLLKTVPRPETMILKNQLKEAESLLSFYEEEQKLRSQINVNKNTIGKYSTKVNNLRAQLRRAIGKPLQNVVTCVCTLCGDEYPIHKKFVYEPKIGGATENVCGPCITTEAKKCDICIKTRQRCDICTKLRIQCKKVVRKTYLGKRGRWPSNKCSTCDFIYYTQVNLETYTQCSYCKFGIKNPYLGTKLEKETEYKEIKEEEPSAKRILKRRKKIEKILEKKPHKREELLAEKKPIDIDGVQKKIDEYENDIKLLNIDIKQIERNLTAYTKKKIVPKKDDPLLFVCNICTKHPFVKFNINICVCKDCDTFITDQLATYNKFIKAHAIKLPLRQIESVPTLMSYDQYNKTNVKPWINVSSGASHISFSEVDVWTKDFLTHKDEKEHAVLSLYHKNNKIFCARDRQRCGLCPSIGPCQHNWYVAHLVIKNVKDTESSDRLIIVVFPGYNPKDDNKVHENELYKKKKRGCQILATDINIRVFLWSELYLLAGEVGTKK